MLQMQQLTSWAKYGNSSPSTKELDGLVGGDEQPISPIVEYVWKVALHVLHNFLVCYKCNSLPLVPIREFISF